jgi:predicted LPLAT superfamily acyltransferase
VIKSIFSVYFNYYNFGQTLIDRVASLTGKYKFNIEFEGEHYLYEIVKQRKGGIMLSAHIGNWEIAGHYLKRIPTTFVIVMYENENINIKKQIERIGINEVVRFIFIKEDLSHIYEMADALNQNQIICMHADRYLYGVKTEMSMLFGDLAPFPIGPWIFATKYKVPVTFVFGMKESNNNYHFYASKPKIYEWQRGEDNFKKGIQNALKEYTYQIELKIQKYPYQWFNYFNFWKKNIK